MSDFDFFPEADYDPASGEYHSEFDFEPTFSERVYLTDDSTVYADVHSDLNFEPEAERVLDVLNDLVTRGVFEEDYDPRNPDDRPLLPDEFDFGDKNVRGPFIGIEAVNRFLEESGLDGIALDYYDADNDEYWIDVNTN